jgi:hypothetical protein
MENLDFQRDFTSPDTFSHLAGDPTRCHEPIQEASCKLLRWSEAPSYPIFLSWDRHTIHQGLQVSPVLHLYFAQHTPEPNLPALANTLCHWNWGVITYAKKSGIAQSQGCRCDLYILPELSQFAIPHLVHNTPFKQMLNLMQAFPELGFPIAFRLEEIVFIPHVLGWKDSHPQTRS